MTAPEPRTLAELQGHLVDLFRRDGAIAGDPSVAPLARAIAAGNERVEPDEQLDIYRRQFWMRHDDSLREDFPGLLHIVGEDGWDAFLRAYLAACPPSDPSLRELPFAARAFAATWPGFPEGRADLARAMIDYELAFVEVFDGPDPEPLPAERVAAVPADAWETTRIVLSPIVRRLRLAYPVHQLRFAIRGGESPTLPDAPAPVDVLLFRRRDVVCFEEIDPDASALLDALGRGVPLVPACAALTEGRPEADVERIGAAVGGWFKRFAELGVFAGIERA
jgi:hypothetical protein